MIFRKSILTLVMVFLMVSADLSMANEKYSFKVDNSFLKKYLPQLKNPRLLTEKDYKKDDSVENIEKDGYSFFIEGDFNKDGNPDYIVAGKYDGHNHNNDKTIFICIFTFKQGKVEIEYLSLEELVHDRVFLRLERGTLMIEGIDPKYDAIMVAYDYGSDVCFVLAWDGKKYIETKEFYFKDQKGNKTF